MCLSPAKSLRLATAYTSYGAADKIIRQLTAYEVCGALWRLTAGWVENRKTLQDTARRLEMCLAAELDLNITHYVD